MVDNAGLGPAYAYGSPDIPPKRLLPVLQVDVPTKPRLLAALRLTLFLAARASPVAVIIVVARRPATRPARALTYYLLTHHQDHVPI